MAPTIIKSVVTPTAGWYPDGAIYDLIDLATVKSILGITDGNSDVKLKLFITQASSAIRKYCNRTFQIQTYSELLWSQRDPYPWQLPSGFEPLQLQEWPLIGPACLSGNGAPSAPGALSAVAGGALASQNYFVRVTYTTPTGESPVSPETNLVVAADNLLQVAPPPADPANIATGWNVYVGTAAGAEQKQNAAPLALNASFTLAATGIQPGTSVPSFVSVTLNANVNNSNISLVPQNLIEGQDFRSDYELGQLTRLFNDGYPRHWEMLPIQVVYQAGFAKAAPQLAEIVDACIRLVRGAYFASPRDPNLRAENIEGVYSAQYWFANGPGGAGFPPDITAMLNNWRMPVIG
jgi:hypothetical protein